MIAAAIQHSWAIVHNGDGKPGLVPEWAVKSVARAPPPPPPHYNKSSNDNNASASQYQTHPAEQLQRAATLAGPPSLDYVNQSNNNGGQSLEQLQAHLDEREASNGLHGNSSSLQQNRYSPSRQHQHHLNRSSTMATYPQASYSMAKYFCLKHSVAGSVDALLLLFVLVMRPGALTLQFD